MIAHESTLFADLRVDPDGERRFRVLAVAATALTAAYALATALGAPAPLLSFLFNVPMLCVAPLVWLAHRRAPAESRRMWLLLAEAATLWLVGTIGWTVEFVRNGDRVPTPPTAWDVLFALAMVLTLAALIIAMRDAVRLRDAALDTLLVVAPGLAVGAAFVDREVVRKVPGASLVSLYRPLLAIAMLMLIVAAALGASDRMRRSVVLIGAGQAFLIVGHLIYSYLTVSGGTLDDRWTDVAWATGAVASILAALAVILRADPLVSFGRPRDTAGYPPGSRVGIVLGFVALLVSGGVTWAGAVAGRPATYVAGSVAVMVVTGAMALRQWSVWSEGRAAYGRLDAALAREERAREDALHANEALRDANRALASMNMRLRMYQDALRGLLEDADRESQGRLRALIADVTGIDVEELDHGAPGDSA